MPIPLLFALLVMTGCTGIPPQGETGVVPDGPLRIEERQVLAADGSRLLHIDDMPGSIRVDDASEFGAAEAFTDALPSPDGKWLAVATAGAAHGAGWLVAVDQGRPYPATFQYGGEVTLGPWSTSGRYASFLNDTPAPSRVLVVVDRTALGATVSATASQVQIPSHAQQVPPETEYEVVAWRDDVLVFEVDGRRYRYQPDTGEVRQAHGQEP
ncbi:hypothetical protein ACOJCM_12025 [Billgrantia sp. LNSP4103-1]|uniref:hypothetical protein n=1 Tax=Billgrantia sp. LNSP4103-1 TaxID=3410266 RepID=UPI00403F7730